jgi:3-hydroxybutyryl-CoA dehydrogenase
MTKPRIAVIGAGLMGHGIAQVFALAGHDVAITDSHAPTLASAKDRILANLTDLGDDVAALERIRVSASLAEAVAEADFIVEAVREDLDVKQQLFADIERAARGDAIVASNTSVIPITAIMGKLESRARALGTIWCRWSR